MYGIQLECRKCKNKDNEEFEIVCREYNKYEPIEFRIVCNVCQEDEVIGNPWII